MDIKAVPLNKFFKNKESVYKNIMIVAARARQIVDERYEKVAAMDDIEDTDDLINIEVEDFNQDKSISIAMDELIDNELEYKNIEEDNNEERDI